MRKSETKKAIDTLEQRLRDAPQDPARRYRLAVLLIDEFGRSFRSDQLLAARKHLLCAVGMRAGHALSHATLGYCHDRNDGTECALVSFREARRLAPRDTVIEVYFLTLLAESGQEEEALAEVETAASRHGVDLHALKSELREVGMPIDARTLLLNGFVHARNHLRSSIEDEAERIRIALRRRGARSASASEHAQCAERQQQLADSFDATRVPESLRGLATWAVRYGVGDDVCRPYLLRRLAKKKRLALIREVDDNAPTIQSWLDSFGSDPMTVEAATFMYLALGVEEIRE